jgi:hypothetical protein
MNNIYEVGKKLTIPELIKESGVSFSKSDMEERISGNHCNCPSDTGEFILLPKDHEAVREGGKRYMVCLTCGQFSHL